jgi:hypothetical protein
MEENKILIGVELTQKDGKFFFNILANDDTDNETVRSILSGGLALSILAEPTPVQQAKVFREVIAYLESEFVNVDSFNDAYVRKENPNS